MNKAILVGRLGADPESNYTKSGAAVSNFRIATDEFFTDREGKPVKRTEWHRIVTFGKVAESCRDYLKKGRQVLIDGRLQTREWERDGVKRYTTEIVANSVQFLGPNPDKAGSKPAGEEHTDAPPPADDTPAEETK